MNIQFKKGILELVVMHEISLRDQYGYELSQNISEFLSIADGTLYPMLRRLVKEGYLDTYMGKNSGGPARKYYAMTQQGFSHLNELEREWNALKLSVEAFLQKGE
ncbi:PadR family transcriptional regulator [Macrococcus hajekii]|uniref:PadR family transcriptional regulator n=1 Tax=Macrococcus hajekii TaxID=198482 RepID=A0A4V3BE93_9STAP|nr:PadR family transcriptional regulator [Macrococcus hajekii]TDM02795.1 PadR family transcriptional regulator [Macrococcus hajekii]GGB03953.1 PadR family transcriptional regulator [Macrococcus hajekii]